MAGIRVEGRGLEEMIDEWEKGAEMESTDEVVKYSPRTFHLTHSLLSMLPLPTLT